MLLAWLVSAALAAAVDARPGEPEIRAEGGEVTIRAKNLPLSQILDRLSSATGMELTYEGPRPTTPVTMSEEGISETQAILKLMEGLGVSYVFRTDATGQRVDLLIVSGSGPGTVAPPASRAAASEPQYEEPVADYGHIPLDPAVLEAAGGATKPDPNNPYLGLPAQHFPQGQAQPQTDTTGASTDGGLPAAGPPGSAPPSGGSGRFRPHPEPPSFPQGGSYPTR